MAALSIKLSYQAATADGSVAHAYRVRAAFRPITHKGTYLRNGVAHRNITTRRRRFQVCGPRLDEIALGVHLERVQRRDPGVVDVGTLQTSIAVRGRDTEAVDLILLRRSRGATVGRVVKVRLIGCVPL